MMQSDFDRVRAHTAPEVLQQIDAEIENSIRFYASQPKADISARIEELEKEWDIERWLCANASAVGLTALGLGVAHNKKWLWLTGGVLGVLLQQSLLGWSPLIPILRRKGLRTRIEIDREKFALKALRGDFEFVSPKTTNNAMLRAADVLRAINA